jgi:hypothetical protein
VSTPVQKPTRSQVLAWMRANPQATEDEVFTYASGSLPSPQRFGTEGVLGKAVALGRGAGNALTFGLMDEIVGGVEGAVRPGMTMGEGIQNERDINREVQQNNKGAYLVGEIAGGVGSGVGATRFALTKSAALASLLGKANAGGLGVRALASGAAGAAGAGAAAFGSAEGNPLERLDNTAAGAGVGGLIGAAFPLIGAAGRGLGNASGIRPRMVNPVRESADMVNEALRQGGSTPDDVIKAASQNPTVPQTALDVGPDQARDLALLAQNRSNSARVMARDLLEERTEGERDRYLKRLGEALNPEDKDIRNAAKELAEIREANAARNFGATLDQQISDPGVASFFREKEVVRAYNEFRENQMTRLRAGKIKQEDVPPELYQIVKDDGRRRIRMTQVDIPLRAFHVVQRAVSEKIRKGFKNGDTIPEDRARVLMEALNKHMDTVESTFKDYGAARAVYRDNSAVIDALDAGAGKKIKHGFGRGIPDFSNSPAEEVRTWLNSRRATAKTDENAAAELEHYMLGAYSFLRKTLKGKRDTQQFLDLQKNKEKIVALFGGQEDLADDFTRALKAEARIKPTSSVNRKGTGIAGDETIPTEAMDILLAGAGVSGGRGYAATSAIARLLRGDHRMSDETATATMDRLFKGVGGIEDLVKGMENLKQAAGAQARRRARNTGATAGAGSAGSAIAQDDD